MGERTLSSILEAVRSNETVPAGELALAVLMLDHLLTFDHRDLRGVCIGEESKRREVIRKMTAEESHRRLRVALERTPREWLGPENLPSSPEFQRRRRIANKLVSRILREEADGA